ncbi:rho GTPase-activating 32-like isoform X7 [Brachionus plicatilis]|uniref:Rho GTPase-activating 32-like isoform X7 n=1 Tax=Brachionus plicatilis TaxID=10195 RepID=A0A3M7S8T8_BRAPC|nr:rho GTPase-activating 32-like isoform X7 [Brachionus plicatilis]
MLNFILILFHIYFNIQIRKIMLKLQQNSDIWQIYCIKQPKTSIDLLMESVKSANVEDKIIEIHDVVQQLPPPHYRTLAYLMKHLHNLAEFAGETNMNTKNLAIVWAPNLLKSKEMDSKDCMQYDMLHSITLQANIAEFLIANADTIFNDKFASLVRRRDLNGSIKSNNGSKNYRPISVCYNNKLITLEEAQDKYKQVGPSDMPKYHTVIEMPEKPKKL